MIAGCDMPHASRGAHARKPAQMSEAPSPKRDFPVKITTLAYGLDEGGRQLRVVIAIYFTKKGED